MNKGESRIVQGLAKLYNMIGMENMAADIENAAKTRENFWWGGWGAEKDNLKNMLTALGKDIGALGRGAVRPLQGAWQDAKNMPGRVGKFELFVDEYTKNGHGSPTQDFSGRNLSNMSDFGRNDPTIIGNLDTSGGNLSGSRLRTVRFSLWNSQDANMRDMDLSASSQSERIDDVNWDRSDLTGTKLRGKAVTGYAEGAIFDGVDLRRADIRALKGLTVDQLQDAIIDDSTQLPRNVVAELQAMQTAMPGWAQEIEMP